MGANAISRPRTQPDPLRIFAQFKGSPVRLVRRWQTPQTALDFPDTEEVTGSNPVRPTRFFEILSSGRSWMGASHLRFPPITAGQSASRWRPHRRLSSVLRAQRRSLAIVVGPVSSADLRVMAGARM